METTSFAEVVPLLREGYVARRADWSGQYVFFAAGGRIVNGKSVRSLSSDEETTCMFLLGGPEPHLPVLPALCLRTPSGIVVGHALSMSDLVALDWETRKQA